VCICVWVVWVWSGWGGGGGGWMLLNGVYYYLLKSGGVSAFGFFWVTHPSKNKLPPPPLNHTHTHQTPNNTPTRCIARRRSAAREVRADWAFCSMSCASSKGVLPLTLCGVWFYFVSVCVRERVCVFVCLFVCLFGCVRVFACVWKTLAPRSRSSITKSEQPTPHTSIP
jgi:hypothetical protein